MVLPVSGCRQPVHDGPIVLITFESLRADSLAALGGRPGLMPRLEELAREPGWARRGVAPSSAGIPALGTLLTGLRPWQHQAIHDGQPGLVPELVTLAEALRDLGYTTAGYPDAPWDQEVFGASQGFDAFARLGHGRRALDRLTHLGDGRHFVWIHLSEPGLPYVRRNEVLARLGPGAPNLPRRLEAAQLQPFFDPARPLPPGLRRRFLSMYRLSAASADERLGLFLDALRASGQWDRTLLAVTSLHGEEFGEHGQILHGVNLGRSALEVPLVVKLPQGSGLYLRPPGGQQRVATARIWSTLVEAAGGVPPPAAAASLFRDPRPEVVSELYLTNGTNRFSLVESGPHGALQLLQESRFAPPEPDYFRTRQAAVFARLTRAFKTVPCFTGDGGAGGQRWTLERWLPGSRTEPVADPGKTAEMARRLALEWHRFVPDELSPRGEASEWGRPDEEAPRRRGRWRKKGRKPSSPAPLSQTGAS